VSYPLPRSFTFHEPKPSEPSAENLKQIHLFFQSEEESRHKTAASNPLCSFKFGVPNERNDDNGDGGRIESRRRRMLPAIGWIIRKEKEIRHMHDSTLKSRPPRSNPRNPTKLPEIPSLKSFPTSFYGINPPQQWNSIPTIRQEEDERTRNNGNLHNGIGGGMLHFFTPPPPHRSSHLSPLKSSSVRFLRKIRSHFRIRRKSSEFSRAADLVHSTLLTLFLLCRRGLLLTRNLYSPASASASHFHGLVEGTLL